MLHIPSGVINLLKVVYRIDQVTDEKLQSLQVFTVIWRRKKISTYRIPTIPIRV